MPANTVIQMYAVFSSVHHSVHHENKHVYMNVRDSQGIYSLSALAGTHQKLPVPVPVQNLLGLKSGEMRGGGGGEGHTCMADVVLRCMMMVM